MDFPRDITRNLPSTEEIIRALGLHTQRSHSSDIVPSVALFGAGLLVGAGLALLFAPSSGRELRDEIGERASELRDKVASTADAAAEATRNGGASS